MSSGLRKFVLAFLSRRWLLREQFVDTLDVDAAESPRLRPPPGFWMGWGRSPKFVPIYISSLTRFTKRWHRCSGPLFPKCKSRPNSYAATSVVGSCVRLGDRSAPNNGVLFFSCGVVWAVWKPASVPRAEVMTQGGGMMFEISANFGRLVLGCIETKFCK